MSYRLPKAWDPGYAMPGNALDEGLERRAFVTKWTPRGSYDIPPNVSPAYSSGYALPKYVANEQIGQGAHATTWSPQGSYAGPRVPHWLNQRTRITNVVPGPNGKAVTVVRPALGDTASAVDDAFPEPWGSYGRQAAAIIMTRMRSVPHAHKKIALRQLLGTIDPSLWDRTAQMTRRYIARGAAPADALHAGLARAMSSGVVAELHKTGKTGRYPQAKGQLGLGCYGCSSVSSLGGFTDTASRERGGTVAGRVDADIGGPHVDGTCTTDSKVIYSKGSWRVRAPSDACVATIPMSAIQVYADLQKSKRPLFVGPFPLPIENIGPLPVDASGNPVTNIGMLISFIGGGQVVTYESPDKIPAPWRAWIAQALLTTAQAAGKGGPRPMFDDNGPLLADGSRARQDHQVKKPPKGFVANALASGGHALYPSSSSKGTDSAGAPVNVVKYKDDGNTYRYYNIADWLNSFAPGLAAQYAPLHNVIEIGYRLGNDMVDYDQMKSIGLAPVAKWQHPVSGRTWGIYLALVPNNGGNSAQAGVLDWMYGNTDAMDKLTTGAWATDIDAPAGWMLQVGTAPIPSQPWYESILDAILWIPGILVGLIGDVVNALGDLVCTVVQNPNAAAGASKGAGGGLAGGAAAAGVSIAQAACGTTAPPPPPPLISPNLLPLAIAGAVGLTAILIATSKPKSKAAP